MITMAIGHQNTLGEAIRLDDFELVCRCHQHLAWQAVQQAKSFAVATTCGTTATRAGTRVSMLSWSATGLESRRFRVVGATPLHSSRFPGSYVMRILGCTSALIRSASHSSAARAGPCSET